jgi:hypothetical protein
MAYPLEGVDRKLDRAEEHLNAIGKLLRPYRYGSFHVVTQYGPNSTSRELVLRLPNPGLPPSIIIGDCLYNMRSALDHLVWQLVELNHHPAGTWNMFPICIDVLKFADDIRRKRLHGVSREAQTIIEALQPYHHRQGSGHLDPLWVLNELANIDKHRTLNLTSVVATTIELEAGPIKVSIVGGEMADGAILLRDDRVSDKVDMNAEGSMFVAFKDAPARKRDVLMELQKIFDFLRQQVLPRFQPFFD